MNNIIICIVVIIYVVRKVAIVRIRSVYAKAR